MIDVPTAIGQLERENVVYGFALPLGIDFAVPVMVGDGVRNESGIDDEFPDPITLGFLLLKEVIMGSLNRLIHKGIIGKTPAPLKNPRHRFFSPLICYP